MGESGNNINIYDTGAFMIQHQIVVNNIITRFKFSNGNQDLMVVTKDCKVRFYSLYKFEGIFLREISSCHRGSICSLAVSANSGYFLTGGQDNMVKIWDYDAQKSHPYFFQSFIGHSYQVNDVLFNPRNN
jgi:WD40 repeat protein